MGLETFGVVEIKEYDRKEIKNTLLILKDLLIALMCLYFSFVLIFGYVIEKLFPNSLFFIVYIVLALGILFVFKFIIDLK